MRMAEMAEMGIGNKPCLDIRPSQDQISDRSISYAQLAKGKKYIFLRNRCKNVLKIGFNCSAEISTLCLRINSVR